MAKKTSLEKASQNDDSNKLNEDPVDDDEEPNFSDPEGYVDDISDEGMYTNCIFKLTHPARCSLVAWLHMAAIMFPKPHA